MKFRHQLSEDKNLDDCYKQAQKIFGDSLEIDRYANAVGLNHSIGHLYRIYMTVLSKGELEIEDEWLQPDNPQNADTFAQLFQEHTTIFTKGLIQMNVYRLVRGEHYGEHGGTQFGFHGFLHGRLDTDIFEHELQVLKRLHDESVRKIRKLLKKQD